ncbi:carboxymuconolactone decarboxylase family protein [Heyndrickxia sporothermodurans]|uniref:carboxymuconolactone decarboxylase family protein n=1 Tax=Heyndrickxia TaxID=2837504 RepID=UPI0030F96854
MTNAIDFFTKVYGKAPDWVVKMNTYNPEALEAYTELRHGILKDGALSRKEKECILVGINAARRYERSMIYHTQGAVDAGATLEELAEILSVCILSRGLPAWLEGIKSLAFAANYMKENDYSMDHQETEIQSVNKNEFKNLNDCLEYYRSMFGSEPKWVTDLAEYHPDALLHYTNLRNVNLTDGKVSRKLKELVLVGINTSERYPEGIRIHTEGARSCGATEAELAECHLTAVLTAGIPAWFEGADLLK